MKFLETDRLSIYKCVDTLLEYPLQEGKCVGNSYMFQDKESGKTFVINMTLKEFLQIPQGEIEEI